MKEDSHKEWEQCFDQVDKFDGYLIDARKYGFTLITGLTTAGSFLGFSDAAKTIQLGVIIVTMVLVGVVYIIDRYYRTLLRTALLRSQSIESEEITPVRRRGLGHYLATTYDKKSLSYLMFSIYLGFVIALVVLGYYVITAEASTTGSQNNTSRLWPAQATDIQQNGDLASRLWETASLWIPLAVTAIIIATLLVTIFRAELTQTKRIDNAKSVIKENEKNRESETLKEMQNRYSSLENYKSAYIPREPKYKQTIKSEKRSETEEEELEREKRAEKIRERKMKRLERDMNKIKREREILDYLEGEKK